MGKNRCSATTDSTEGSPEWFVYIIRTESDRLYTGITTDPERRLEQHRTGRGGAKFFRLSRPVELIYVESQPDRSAATRREREVKALSRARKLALAVGWSRRTSGGSETM